MVATAAVLSAAHISSDRDPTMVVRDATRRFASGRGVFDIRFEVCAGEFVALAGPSGAGKTTLLRLLAGLERPDAGEVLRAGRRFERPQRGDTRVAVIFQQPRLVGRIDAVHNVLAGRLGHVGRWRGMLKRFERGDWDAAFEALHDVDLLNHAADRSDRLSGGEQQRLMIARALAQQPMVLLADEPVASLDPDNARVVMQLLRDCARRGLAVVASLHQPQLAGEFATRIVHIENGRIRPPEGEMTPLSPTR
jgi:phosphonate transport system ATP-binding protein